MATTDTHEIGRGDVVRVGKGYQHWTVLSRAGDTLHLESDPSRGAIAGTPARRKQTTVDRVALFETAWNVRVRRTAQTMGVDHNTTEGREVVEQALRATDQR